MGQCPHLGVSPWEGPRGHPGLLVSLVGRLRLRRVRLSQVTQLLSVTIHLPSPAPEDFHHVQPRSHWLSSRAEMSLTNRVPQMHTFLGSRSRDQSTESRTEPMGSSCLISQTGSLRATDRHLPTTENQSASAPRPVPASRPPRPCGFAVHLASLGLLGPVWMTWLVQQQPQRAAE